MIKTNGSYLKKHPNDEEHHSSHKLFSLGKVRTLPIGTIHL